MLDRLDIYNVPNASKRSILVIVGKANELELAADGYAALVIDKCATVKALQWICDGNYVIYLGKRELRMRIKALK